MEIAAACMRMSGTMAPATRAFLALCGTVAALPAVLLVLGKKQPEVPGAMPPPAAPPPDLRLPDYRLKWLGAGARAVSVSGDWNRWSSSGVPMERDETGAFAADIYLPTRCPRINLIMRGVCCYRYKFYVDTGTRRRWQRTSSRRGPRSSKT